MTIHVHGHVYYDHAITVYRGRFFWHVVRFTVNAAEHAQVVIGVWVAGGVVRTRRQAEQLGRTVIEADFKKPGPE